MRRLNGRAAVGDVRRRLAPVGTRLRPVLAVVTPLGWTVLTAGLLGWFLASRLSWAELDVVAAACLVLFVLCSLLMIGRASLRVDVELEPQRVTAGESAAGRIGVTNLARLRLLPLALELPVGSGAARFDLPSLRSGATHEELFVVPTKSRGVIPVGPATTVRGDPLGLFRRSVAWTGVIDLYVHPKTVALETFGSGLLRDLEGVSTNDTSMTDLDFHTLRDYAPGDDRRYIHWRSSAKVSSAIPGSTFLVRQFLDTRRSHLTVIVDGQSDAYIDPDDFEVAVSAAASMAVRALRDEMPATVLAAQRVLHETTVSRTLDGLSSAELGTGTTLPRLAGTGARIATDTSIAVIITGANATFPDLLRAASHFPLEVATLAIRVDPTKPAGMSSATTMVVLSLPRLSALPALLAASRRP
jgi:uncharacterized protein (DUF58 family)